ncbi:quinolinate synthase [Actinidia rufa]|uniref:quinolinate synthase n=1 Tax=Actinidia rufa TaxID=165716 RepID=A0A7J0GME4_9ERIC|nr:quinolinate synthase [Actinidia rufa]
MDSATIRVSSSSCSSSPSSCFSKLRNPNPSPNSISSRLNFTFFKSFNRIQTPSPDFTASHSSPLKPKRRNPRSSSMSFPCCVATSPPSRTSDLAISKLERLVSEFESLSEPIDRVKRLLYYASLLSPTDDSLRRDANRVMGWRTVIPRLRRGFARALIWVLDGAEPEEVLNLKTEDLMALSVAGLQVRSNSRVNTWHNVLIGMQKRTKGLVAEREGKPPGEPFPSLVITADGIHAKGSYAEAQARFLLPDELKIQELINVLSEKRIGVVAHFYMDPEVQGVLTAAQKHWPHIHISDSLVMADMAVKMAKAGCQYITVLGVDFMSENVRAILDQAGFSEVGVYRMSSERIGCSLADAASNPAYMDYLEAASLASPSLHVVYINTSLETKANAHELVPTITCTSSNVVQTILQAFAQVPGLNVWYGPDTYMGANIVELFQQMTVMTDDEIAEIHPEHNQDTN